MHRAHLQLMLAGFAIGVAHAWTTKEILATSGVHGGLVVLIGCDKPELLAELGASGPYLVQGLESFSMTLNVVQKGRAYIQSKNLSEKVGIDSFDGEHLPFVNNSVNLLVAENADLHVPEAEIMRVLAPRGVAMVDGKKTVKPLPAGIGDWTHYMYDASGTGSGKDTEVSRPRCMQWEAAPKFSRSHENMSSVSAVVTANGRIFSIMDEGPTASIYLPPDWELAARDAFSGVLLWKIPIKEWNSALFPLKSGPIQLPHRLVAVGDRVYATLGLDAPVTEIDAATGKILHIYKGTEHAEELLCLNGKLVVVANATSAAEPFEGKTPKNWDGFTMPGQVINLKGERSIIVLNPVSGKIEWTTKPGDVVPLTTVAAGNSIFTMVGSDLRCLNMADGHEMWKQTLTKSKIKIGTTASPTLLVYGDTVLVGNSGTMNAVDTKTGKTLWEQKWTRGYGPTLAPVLVAGDLVWNIQEEGEPYKPGDDLDTINQHFLGYDPRSGDLKKTIPVSSDYGFGNMHHRCYIPRASGDNIITSWPGIEFFNTKNGTSTHDSWLRGACVYGFIPANGMIYAPPHPCACYMDGKLSGFWAYSGESERADEVNGAKYPRLTKGEAYGQPTQATPSAAGDWPTYRGNAARNGYTKTAVSMDVKPSWKAKIGGKLSSLVIAEGKVFIAQVDEHAVYALDQKSGKTVWSYVAGGRVDSPPTIYNGLALFGCADGYVYCLRASDGALVWKFRAAPSDRRCVAMEQVESVWPVHGSVLVQNNEVWFCAGRSSYIDGGLVLYRLDPVTGKFISDTRVNSLGERNEQPPIASQWLCA